MSGVDVLAVLDALSAVLNHPRSAVEWQKLQPVRAAVAELIEADKEYDAAENEAVAHHVSALKQDEAWRKAQSAIDDRCDRAISRRAAALARVTGAAA